MTLKFKKRASIFFLLIFTAMNFQGYHAEEILTDDYEQILADNEAAETMELVKEQTPNRYIIKYIEANGAKVEDTDKIIINDSLEVIISDDEIDIDKEKRDNENIEYIQPDYLLYLCEEDSGEEMTEENSVDVNTDETATENNVVDSVKEAVVETSEPTSDNDAVVEVSNEQQISDKPVVAVIDTGIYTEHEALANKIWSNNNETEIDKDGDGNGFAGDINGWDFVNNTPISYRANQIVDYTHGTHIAGIIAGESENIQGINSPAEIMPLKVFENGTAFTSDVIRAIEYADKMGADVINCSFGSVEYNTALENTIADTDMIFICAAGNHAADIEEKPFYPASFDCENIITVAASDGNNLAYFSNYGDNVDVAVSGVSVKSCTPENEYGYSLGTSVSAAYVSGIIAEIISENNTNDVEVLKSSLNSRKNKSNSDDPRINGMSILELGYAGDVMSEEEESISLMEDKDDYTTLLPIEGFNAGGSHSVVQVDKKAFIFGANWAVNGEYYWGDGDFAAPGHVMFDSGYPNGVPNASQLFVMKKVSARGDHTLLLLRNGTVQSVGDNNYGQLGAGYVDGYITDGYDPPVNVVGLKNIVDIAGGHQFSMALDSSGRVYAWGNNKDGQVGIDSTYPFFTTPQLVEGLPKIKEISAGHYHALAKAENGDIYAWGRAYNGALGEQSVDKCYSPVKLNIDNVDKAIAGLDNSFFIKEDKTVYACGLNAYGQLGDGTLNKRTAFSKVSIEDVVDVSTNFATIFLTEDGTAYGCGANAYGQLGIGSTATAVREIKKIPGTYTAVSAGGSHTLFLNDTGLYSAGRNQRRQCGFYDASAIYTTPTLIPSFSKDGFTVTDVYVDYETEKLVIEGNTMLDNISVKVTVNGKSTGYPECIVENNKYKILCEMSSVIKGKNEIVVTIDEHPMKCKFNFNYNPSTEQVAYEYNISAVQGQQSIVAVNVEHMENVKDKVFTVDFDGDLLELDDACAQTYNKDIAAGDVGGTDINIISVSDSQVKFKTSKSQLLVSGTINMLRFKAIKSGDTVIKITAASE